VYLVNIRSGSMVQRTRSSSSKAASKSRIRHSPGLETGDTAARNCKLEACSNKSGKAKVQKSCYIM